MDAARDEGKKRGPKEEAEAEVHQAFRRSANTLSQFYAQSVTSQKASFRAGERSAMVRQLNPPSSLASPFPAAFPVAPTMIGCLSCGRNCSLGRVLGSVRSMEN
jgi:hypothetical protein